MSTETLIWLAIMFATFGVVWFAAPYHGREASGERPLTSKNDQGRPTAEALRVATTSLPEQRPSHQGFEPGKSHHAHDFPHGTEQHDPDHGRESRVLH